MIKYWGLSQIRAKGGKIKDYWIWINIRWEILFAKSVTIAIIRISIISSLEIQELKIFRIFSLFIAVSLVLVEKSMFMIIMNKINLWGWNRQCHVHFLLSLTLIRLSMSISKNKPPKWVKNNIKMVILDSWLRIYKDNYNLWSGKEILTKENYYNLQLWSINLNSKTNVLKKVIIKVKRI